MLPFWRRTEQCLAISNEHEFHSDEFIQKIRAHVANCVCMSFVTAVFFVIVKNQGKVKMCSKRDLILVCQRNMKHAVRRMKQIYR